MSPHACPKMDETTEDYFVIEKRLPRVDAQAKATVEKKWI
jgi:hypothetical protein